MNIFTFLTVILAIPSFFKNIHRELYEEGQNSENSYLFEYLSNAMNSFDRFLNNLYIVIGSSVMASVIDPENPEEKAGRIFTEFEESYHEFYSDFRRLLDSIIKEKERFSAESGAVQGIADLFPVWFSGNLPDPTTLMEWLSRDDNPYLNNERVFCNTMRGSVTSFAQRELGVRDFSPQEIINDLLVSVDQLAGILGLACISYMGSMKVRE